MNFLKRELAPITDEAWLEIDKQAKNVFLSTLSARKFVDVVGPKGWNYSAVNVGRLAIPAEHTKYGVKYGLRQIMPLIETRENFSLNMMELDVIDRGAENPDLDPVDEAVKKSAFFEEKAIYEGFPEAGIGGFNSEAVNELPFPNKKSEVLHTFAKAKTMLINSAIEGPYSLVINPEKWIEIVNSSENYPLSKQIKEVIGSSIILTPNIDNALFLSTRGGDFELTLGQDFSIGYKSHNGEEVDFIIVETFTFRIIEPKAFVKIG